MTDQSRMLSNRAHSLLDFASRNSLRLFMAVLALAALFYSIYNLLFMPAYTIADWLINYSDGFVRRGLIGQFILLSAHAIHIPTEWLAVPVQLTIYVALLAGVYRLAAPLRRDMLWYAMMFSPAALAFMLLNPFNGVRKEILAPVALTAVIFFLRRKPNAVVLSLIITVLFAVMVLSHEAPCCCLPYFFAAIALARRDLKYAAKVMALPVLITCLLFEISRLHPGDQSTAIAICHSIGGHWIGDNDYRNLCSGAILRVSWTLTNARQETLQNLHYWPLYSFLAILSLAPYVTALIVLYKRDGRRFDVRIISGAAVLAAIASFPLFYLAIDWGRWIQMQILCLLLVILMTAQHARGFQPDANAHLVGAGKRWRRPLLIAVFVYCTCWTLPVLGLESLRFGYLGLPRNHFLEFRNAHRLRVWRTVDRGW